MKDNNIRPYDEPDSFYSGTDEEYEEFLKTVDGKINTANAVEDEQMKDDLGATKTINLQGVIDKFRKTAETIKDASKKITSEAASRIEEMTKQQDIDSDTADEQESNEHEADEVVIDIEDIKNQISEAVKSSLPENSAPDESTVVTELIKSNDKKLEEVISECRRISDLLKDIEVNSRDGASSAENARLKSEMIAGGVEEIRQAISGVSKLNDSIFDLKNAQLNAKKSLKNLETGFIGLKKKCILGITVVSILTLISIGMSVLVLLS